MEQMTITEALAEVKLLEKKMLKKRELVYANLYRVEGEVDPLEKEGGSQKVLSQELQSIFDLNTRLLKIRAAIAQANLQNEITVGKQTRSIFDWLTWKREVAGRESEFFRTVHTRVKSKIEEARNKPPVAKDMEGNFKLLKVLPTVDYSEYFRLEEETQNVLEQLDGKLSLKNATIVVSL